MLAASAVRYICSDSSSGDFKHALESQFHDADILYILHTKGSQLDRARKTINKITYVSWVHILRDTPKS